jgi:hypothetical protein
VRATSGRRVGSGEVISNKKQHTTHSAAQPGGAGVRRVFFRTNSMDLINCRCCRKDLCVLAPSVLGLPRLSELRRLDFCAKCRQSLRARSSLLPLHLLLLHPLLSPPSRHRAQTYSQRQRHWQQCVQDQPLCAGLMLDMLRKSVCPLPTVL